MDNLYESKFMKSLQRFGERLSSNKVFSAISNGMMITMGLMLVGAVFQIIATTSTLLGWCTKDSAFYKFTILPYDMTMGLISIVIAFAIAYAYSKMLGMKQLVNGINSMLLFLMVAAPATTVTLADGKTIFTGLSNDSLGGAGIFAAILIAIFSVKISHFFEKHNIVFKMPDVVPQFLQDSFTSLIPLGVNVLIWHGLNTLVVKVFTVTLPTAIAAILAMPLGALTSIPGMIICVFLATLLWSFGIAGKPAVFAPVALFGILGVCGGAGNTLPLVVMGLRSKSEQIKAVSKAALIPGIFNINEPVTFGFPIMYNPILAIGYILNPIIVLLAVWGGYAIGFFKPAYVMIMTLMPLGVGEFLGSMAWQNALMPVVAFIIAYIVYRPFFKVYEKQLVEKEALAREELAKEAEAI